MRNHPGYYHKPVRRAELGASESADVDGNNHKSILDVFGRRNINCRRGFEPMKPARRMTSHLSETRAPLMAGDASYEES